MKYFLQETAQQAEVPPINPAAVTLPLIHEHSVLGHVSLSHSSNDEVHATVDLGQRCQTIPVKSALFKKVLAMKFYKNQGKVPKKGALKAIAQEIDWIGQFDAPKLIPNIRYAKIGDTIYVDLSDRQGHFVRIDRDGWSIHRHSIASPPFIRNAGMKEQVLPEKGGSIEDLRPFLNIGTDDQFILTVAFILGAMQPNGPFPILTVHGPQGASKSTMLKIIRSIVDPSEAALTAPSSSVEDLFLRALHTWMHCIDNVSTLSNKMSDAYCQLVTGGVYHRRTKYRNTEETIIKVKRPVAFNGIAPFAKQNDFLDRSIWLELSSVSDANRKPESEIWPEWDKARPRILGAVFDAVAMALKNLNQVKLDSLPRMADFARWVVAAEPACPWAHGDFMRVYEGNRTEMIDIALEYDPVGDGIQKLMKDRMQWHGTTTKLLDTLNEVVRNDIKKHKEWPRAAITLSKRLMRLEGFLAARGLKIDRRRTPQSRLITMSWAEFEKEVVEILDSPELAPGQNFTGAYKANHDTETTPRTANHDDATEDIKFEEGVV